MALEKLLLYLYLFTKIIFITTNYINIKIDATIICYITGK